MQAAGFDREGLSSKVKEQHSEIEELKQELMAREEKVRHGEFAINWVKEREAAGEIAIDEHGRPNIIRNLDEVWEDEGEQE